MKSGIKMDWRLCGALLIFICIGLSSCDQSILTPIPREEVEDLADNCREMYSKQILAWDSRDERQLREVYTEDIVHYDGGPAYVGIDKVVNMAKNMYVRFNNWQMAAGKTYISADECLGTWRAWGIMGFEEDDPGLEFDIIEIQDGGIAFWRLFYDEKFDFSPIDHELLTRFTEVWSAKNNRGLKTIYDEDAILEDTLFGVRAIGLEEINLYAKSFKKDFFQGNWVLLIPFSESRNPVSDLQPANGGVFLISLDDQNSCQVSAVMILSTNQDGKVAHQLTLYDANSLIDCGLVKDTY